jgi:hypothetical protein
MKKPKMKAINLLKVAEKIEKVISEYTKVYCTDVSMKKRKESGLQLSCTIFYTKESKNFSAYLYEENGDELSVDNLIFKLKCELKELGFKANLTF